MQKINRIKQKNGYSTNSMNACADIEIRYNSSNISMCFGYGEWFELSGGDQLTMLDQYYTRHFSRRYPGLFIILLDQSGSMSEKVEGRDSSKAEFATTTINSLIYEMVQAAKFDVSTGKRRKYAYLSVYGYSDSVYPLLSDEPLDIPFLGDNIRGTVPIMREMLDSHTGSYRQVSENRPFWIEPHAQGKTHMAEAFSCARDVARHWLAAPPEHGQAARVECFPPVIINITDAQDNGSSNPVPLTYEIRREGTQQGNILIFNCHFTKQMGQSCIFPASAGQVAQLDPPFAEQMFEMSSVIPEPLRKKAAAEFSLGQDVEPGARSFVYNADANILVKFLHWGTIGTAIE